jgi:hypothetical protein
LLLSQASQSGKKSDGIESAIKVVDEDNNYETP